MESFVRCLSVPTGHYKLQLGSLDQHVYQIIYCAPIVSPAELDFDYSALHQMKMLNHSKCLHSLPKMLEYIFRELKRSEV
jgi:hypothetical protein